MRNEVKNRVAAARAAVAAAQAELLTAMQAEELSAKAPEPPPLGEIHIVLLPGGHARVSSKCRGGPDSSAVPVQDARAAVMAVTLVGEIRNRLAGLTREGLSRGPLGMSR